MVEKLNSNSNSNSTTTTPETKSTFVDEAVFMDTSYSTTTTTKGRKQNSTFVEVEDKISIVSMEENDKNANTTTTSSTANENGVRDDAEMTSTTTTTTTTDKEGPSDNNKNNETETEKQEEEDEETKQKRLEEDKAKEEAEKKRIEELKKKFANWPLRSIKEVHDHDVMYGRGGGTNHHPGNKRYRKMVEDRKLEYVNSKRLDKPLVALEIIKIWRSQLPPGRFLKIDEKTGLWHDVGDKKAREKTSQALREKAPMIRKQLDEEDSGDDADGSADKTTRFADGTKGEASKSSVKKAVLARDHSLGREYLGKDEAVTLEGFTWQDPFNKGKPKEMVPPGHHVPAGRNSSSGSIGMAPPYHQTSFGAPPPPPPPPDYYGRVASGDPRRELSNGSFGSWGPYSSFSFPPPPPSPGHTMHHRSGSWTHPLQPPPPPPPGATRQRSGSWSGLPPGREHSLSYNPLMGANIGSPADRAAFGGRAGSGYWGEYVRPPPPPPPPSYYGGIPYMSSGSMGGYGPPPPAGYGPPPPTGTHSNTPSPPYTVDMDIARTWSGGEIRTTSWMAGPEPGTGASPSPNPYDGGPPAGPAEGSDPKQLSLPAGSVPRPSIVKRDTSNQNEQPMIKKAALNRDQSATSNRLKREYLGPEYFNREMQTLQETTEQIRLSPSGPGASAAQTTGIGSARAPKPQNISAENRMTTAEVITMDLMAKPAPLLAENRVSTIDALDLDLDGPDSTINTDELDNTVAAAAASSYRGGEDSGTGGGVSMPKPPALGPQNRLTTQEFIDIVSGPLVSISDKMPTVGEDDDPLPLS
mmetsp:Transcript_26091/g.61972  ORF Transcript_26091/g.61972 Transcript_26091/m.61972 type:complete len:808 (+) Transcript_26091:275-2698(+)